MGVHASFHLQNAGSSNRGVSVWQVVDNYASLRFTVLAMLWVSVLQVTDESRVGILRRLPVHVGGL
jgi:hypothetical protein